MHESIRRLDDLTIARIAAGEVVERPASIVKELVENSLDAGATSIQVEIREGGRRLVSVGDNGHGIRPDEVELAFEKHATSKLRDAEQLERIASLGFRGEALASIASVSHVTLLTRSADQEAGLRLRIDNGKILSRETIGAPKGTRIEVENLFNAMPARLKFLRQAATEAGHVQDVIARYALAHPECAFRLTRDGRQAFRSPGTGDIQDALAATFGADLARSLIPVKGERKDAEDPLGRLKVEGWVSPPHIHRANRRQITLLVNGRWVQDRQLVFAVIQAYHTLIPKGRYPLAVVKIELPPEAVDINVHPAKTELRFRNSRPVFATVQRAVRAAVVGQAPVAPLERPRFGDRPVTRHSETYGKPRFNPRPDGEVKGDSDAWATGSGRLDESGALVGLGESAASYTGQPPAANDAEGGVIQPGLKNREGAGLPMLRVIGQMARAYILAEGPDGLYLIDQHAAHERVMYEQFMARESVVRAQGLLAPVTVPLTAGQVALVETQAEAFERLGFEIEPFGSDAALVRALPDALAKSSDVVTTVRSILDLAEEGRNAIEDAFEARLVLAVCKRASVKAGQSLSPEEMRGLILALEATDSPWTCPHGRPTIIVMSEGRLEREFGRT